MRTRLSRKQFAKVGTVSDDLTPLEVAHTVPIVGGGDLGYCCRCHTVALAKGNFDSY